MDVSRAYSAVAPTVEGDVLMVLAGTTQPLSGRRVARLAQRGSVAAVAKALDRLVRQGVVLRQEAPPALLYTLNRQHVAAPAVELLALIRIELLERLRQAFSTWGVPPVHASLFGSAARGDGDLDSDIDIFVVRPSDVDAEDTSWDAQLRDIGDGVLAWTGNRAGVIDFAERDIGQMRDGNPPVLQELLRDAVDLAGTPLRELLEGPRVPEYPCKMASPPYTISDLRSRRADIESVAARHHATNIRVIGSAARDEADELSDIDLMVDMDPEHTLTGFAYFGELDRLEKELTALLRCDVDVVDAAGISANAHLLSSGARVRDNMMRDAIAL
jgi:predicted nucleotidyltransferase